MAPTEDEEIVRRIRSGDSHAEDELARRLEPGLLAIARVRLGADLAPDLVQEVFAIGLSNLRRGDWKGEGPLAAYLAAILRRRMLRLVSGDRSASDEDPDALPAAGLDPLAAAVAAETRAQLLDALRRLPARHREVVLRHYFQGASVDEVARDMSLPRGTVLSRLHHARTKLANALNRARGGTHYPSGGGRSR